MSAIIIFKPLWQRAWFWAVIGIIAIAHSAAVWLISWPDDHLYGVELVPIIFADVAAIIGLIWILHKLVARFERG